VRKCRFTTLKRHLTALTSRLSTRTSRFARCKEHLVCRNEHFTSRNRHLGSRNGNLMPCNRYLMPCNGHLMPCNRHDPSKPNITMPSKTSLEAWLDQVYGNQINAWFEVTYHAQTDYDYTPTGNQTFMDPQLEGMAGETAYSVPIDVPLRIFIIDAELYETAPAMFALAGIASVATSSGFVINHHPSGAPRNEQEMNEVIAHELGHLLLGGGHPDENGGFAPLYGTNRSNRLMCSGYNRTPGAKLLVKTEWDRAESWLRNALNE
jgi:hypothetical protein